MSARRWINIASANQSFTSEMLRELAAKSPPVPIGPLSLGETLRFEMRGEDLWAEVEWTPAMAQYARAAAVIVATGGEARLVGVLMSNMTRDQIRALVQRAAADAKRAGGAN